ncbi:MAG: autotransporter domain-containing protein [Rhizobiaceae bacterium]|nr:autotransporter domain-containing protein [Rhizobiaceae bacterium]
MTGSGKIDLTGFSVAGGDGGQGVDSGADGAGGAGIQGANLDVMVASSVSGGLGGDGVTRANAISFTGGTNVLELRNGFTFVGIVDATAGTNDVFALGGAADGAINVTGFGAGINGFERFEKRGTSTWTLIGSAAGQHTPWTLKQGILEISSDEALGNASGDLTFDGGTLQPIGNFPMARDVVLAAGGGTVLLDSGGVGFAGDISGPGGLTIDGNGTLSLLGSNTYAGATRITGGASVGVFGDEALSANSAFIVDAGGFVSLAFGVDARIGSLAGAGRVSVSGAALTTGGNDSDTTFSGIISGPGGALTKAGGGIFTLSGTNTYTGATTVAKGTLLVNGSTATSSLTTVAGGATLGGSGTVGNTYVEGTLAPGNSVGTLTVAGTLGFGAGSTYLVELGRSGSDKVNVTGTASLTGGTVKVSYVQGGLVAKRYTVLTAAGGLGGTTFAGVTARDLPLLKATLEYDGTDADLVLDLKIRPGDPDPDPDYKNLTDNQQAVADVLLAYFDKHGKLPAEFAALTKAGLGRVAGEASTGVVTAGVQSADGFLGLLGDPANGADTGAGSGGHAGLSAYAGDDAPRTTNRFARLVGRSGTHSASASDVDAAFASRWKTWGGAYGGSGWTGGDARVGSHDTTARTWGLAGGIERAMGNGALGIALGGGSTSFDLAGGMGSGTLGSFNAGVYANQSFGGFYVAAAGTYAYHDVSTTRAVPGDTLSGDFAAHSWSGRAEAGYRIGLPAATVTPYAAYQAIHVRMPAYSETAAGLGVLALDYAASSVTATRAEFGWRAEHTVAMGGDLSLTLTGRAAWAINGGTGRSATAMFPSLPGTSFTVNGAAPARHAALIDLGADLGLGSGLSLSTTLQGEFSRNVSSYGARGKISYRW